jgi:UDP-3-O-acyl-N-acetylglucosamine deacetylase
VIFTRKTVRDSVVFEGEGLHSGVPVNMTVHPGENGIWLQYQSEKTKLHPANVTDTTRSTKVGSIGTVEHIVSALAGMEITDAVIEFTAPEVPGVDGSAQPFVEKLNDIGTENLQEQQYPNLYRRLFFQEADIKIAVGKGTGHWRYDYEIDNRWPFKMTYEASEAHTNYSQEIAPARTFALNEEIPMIMKMGLGLGLDSDSALVLGDDGYKNVARFDDEPARHKLLDLIGDLYLSGVPIRFLNVVGVRSGHRTHVEMAKMICESLQISA